MANQEAKRDANNTPTMLAMTAGGETVRVVVNNDGTIGSGGGGGGLTNAELRASAVPVDTELPAAAALAANTANPTVPAVGSFGMVQRTASGTWYPVAADFDSADGMGSTSVVTRVLAEGMCFNNTGWDRRRGNYEATILASASRASGATNSTDQTNHNNCGLHLIVNVTDVGGAGTLTVKLQGKDPISANYYDLPGAATASLVATGTILLSLYPGIAEVANSKISGVLPRTWRAVATVGVNNVTFSVAASVIG